MDYIAQIKLFLIKQISSALHDLQGNLTPDAIKAIVDRAKPYVLGALNQAEGLIPWVGGLLNTDQFNALESTVYDSEEIKIVAAIGVAATNIISDIEGLLGVTHDVIQDPTVTPGGLE